MAAMGLLALLACGPKGQGEGTETGETTGMPAQPAVTDGPSKVYDAEGRLELEGTMRRGERHGVWTSYFPDGRVRSRNEYREGRLEGITTAFRPNGSLYYTGQHLNGKEVGTWRFYDELGNLARTVEYDTTGTVVRDSGEGG